MYIYYVPYTRATFVTSVKEQVPEQEREHTCTWSKTVCNTNILLTEICRFDNHRNWLSFVLF